MKLHGSIEYKITKDKDCENLPHLEITEGRLVRCYILNNDYQQDSRVLYTFVANKPFSSLLETAQIKFIPLKAFNSEFQEIGVWLQLVSNSQPLSS